MGTYFASGSAGGAAASSSVDDGSAASGLYRLGSAAAALAAAEPDSMLPQVAGDGTHVLQRLVAERLGLLPTEEGKQMLHYVIPQVSSYTCMLRFMLHTGWLSGRPYKAAGLMELAAPSRQQCCQHCLHHCTGSRLQQPVCAPDPLLTLLCCSCCMCYAHVCCRALGLSCSACWSCWMHQTGSGSLAWQRCTCPWPHWRRSSSQWSSRCAHNCLLMTLWDAAHGHGQRRRACSHAR